MDRFLKEKTMKEATSAYKILQVPFDQTSENKDASKVEIGFAAEAALSKLKSQKKISDRQVLEIKMDCKTFLIALLLKLVHKTHVQYPLKPAVSRSQTNGCPQRAVCDQNEKSPANPCHCKSSE